MALPNLYDRGIRVTGGYTYTPPPPKELSWFGQDGIMAGIGQGAQAVGAIGGLYTGIQGLDLQKKQLELGREQFGLSKALSERNLANQAQLINQERANATEVGLGLASHLSQADKDAARAKTAAGNVRGTL